MFDIYKEVTDRIIAELEKGIIPWNKPWTGGCDGAISHANGKPYSLLNQFVLDKPGEYLTFKQCAKEGGKIKKGAKSKFVVFWKMIEVEKKDKTGIVVTDADGKPKTDIIPVLKYFNVFHVDDCEGIKAKFDRPMPTAGATPIEAAEATLADYVKRSGIRLVNRKQDRAYYSPASDTITLPLMEQFMETAEYYSTAFHEVVHSTGHSTRLNRFTDAGGFGSEPYSKEELVAEIGAASILNYLRIETASSFKNSAAYIQNWLKHLRDDKRLIVSAASRAEKAVKLVLNTDAKEIKQAA